MVLGGSDHQLGSHDGLHPTFRGLSSRDLQPGGEPAGESLDGEGFVVKVDRAYKVRLKLELFHTRRDYNSNTLDFPLYVVCMPFDRPEPPQLPDTDISAGFQITEVDVEIPQRYDGMEAVCPVRVPIDVTISATESGTVRYRLVATDGTASNVATADLTPAADGGFRTSERVELSVPTSTGGGTVGVSHELGAWSEPEAPGTTFELETAADIHSKAFRLELLSPVSRTSELARYHITCRRDPMEIDAPIANRTDPKTPGRPLDLENRNPSVVSPDPPSTSLPLEVATSPPSIAPPRTLTGRFIQRDAGAVFPTGEYQVSVPTGTGTTGLRGTVTITGSGVRQTVPLQLRACSVRNPAWTRIESMRLTGNDFDIRLRTQSGPPCVARARVQGAPPMGIAPGEPREFKPPLQRKPPAKEPKKSKQRGAM